MIDMWQESIHAECMSSTLQIRNVPKDVHRALKARAAQAGTSLSDYLLTEMTRLARRPSFPELLERIKQREAVQNPLDSASAVREGRDGR